MEFSRQELGDLYMGLDARMRELEGRFDWTEIDDNGMSLGQKARIEFDRLDTLRRRVLRGA